MPLSDGGAAYPSEFGIAREGMTLRDWFAGKALASGQCSGGARDWELTAWFGKNIGGITKEQIMAAQAYAIADAMIARGQKS